MNTKEKSPVAREQVLYEKIMSIIGKQAASAGSIEEELRYIAREVLVIEIATEYAKNKAPLVSLEKQFCKQMYQEISSAPSVTVIIGALSVNIANSDKESDFIKFIQREIELQIRTVMADASRFDGDFSALVRRVSELKKKVIAPKEVTRKDVVALGKIVADLRDIYGHKNLIQQNGAKVYEIYSMLGVKKLELEGLNFSE